jgi:hypothetical protein
MRPAVQQALAVKKKVVPKFRQPSEYYLTDKLMDRFHRNWPDFKWAARKVKGIPPIAFGGVNFRETGGRRKATVEGGWGQLDLGGSGKAHHAKLQKEANRICRKYGVTPGDLDTDFRTGAIVVAETLRKKSKNKPMIVGGKINWDNVAWALWGYNGRSQWHTPDGKKSKTRRSYKYSPYVSNDPKRGVTFRIKGTMPLPEGMTVKKAIAKYGAARVNVKRKRLKIDRPDKRTGALIIAQELHDRREELV